MVAVEPGRIQRSGRSMSSRALAALLMVTALAAGGEQMLVRIHLDAPEQVRVLDDLGLDFVSEAMTADRDAIVTEAQLAEIRVRGFSVEVRQSQLRFAIPAEYHDLLETRAVLESLQTLHPQILHIYTVGWSQWRHEPVWAIRISDNPAAEEDEPAVQFTGVTHAREPMTNEIVIHLAKYLCAGYDSSAQVRRWVDSIEIWLVPVLNIDGFLWLFDSATVSPWWRKNQRDNNNNGRFDKNYDGVDLNRNFDWRWTYGGSTNPPDLTYRGPYAGSEAEVQAWCRLSRRELPVFGIGYHSYGDLVIYPWRHESRATPDEDVLLAVAQAMAQRIGYTVSTTGGSNTSSAWNYARAGVLDYMIETVADEFVPPGSEIAGVCAANFNADTFLLNRVLRSAICGHTTDAVSGSPVVAQVQVLGRVDSTLDPRLSDSSFGRYWRALQPGVYTLRFIAAGYETLTRTALKVGADSLTHYEARLQPTTGIADGRREGRRAVTVTSSPFVGSTALVNAGPVEVMLFDAGGRLVERCSPRRVGANVPAGVYWLRLTRTDCAVRIVKLK